MKYILIFLSCLACGFGFGETTQHIEIRPLRAIENGGIESQENQLLTPKEKLDLYRPHLHPLTFHHPQRYKNCLIQLKDTSIWNLLPEDREIILNWKKSHELVILPVYSDFWPSFLISYNYALYNVNENTFVSVYLDKIENNALLIETIDTASHTLLLNDKSRWEMDRQTDISSWKVGQRILIGINHEWYNIQYPQILINADASCQHVSAIYLTNQQP